MQRRELITGLISFIAAPAIVRASSLMPIKPTALIVSGFDMFGEPMTEYIALRPKPWERWSYYAAALATDHHARSAHDLGVDGIRAAWDAPVGYRAMLAFERS